MNTPVYITDIIGQVVTATMNAKVIPGQTKTLLQQIQENETATHDDDSPSLIQTIDYQYGHKRELIETLLQKDKSDEERELKYPLIYLVQDFPEDRNKIPGIYAEVSLNIIIAHHTVNTHKITERYSKVFKPVLYPIYDQFIKQLCKHKQIHDVSELTLKHRKTDRSYWGRNAVGGNDQNKLNDYVDAIEIDNLILKINYNNC